MFTKFNAIWKLSKGNRAEYVSAIVALVVASCFLYLSPMIPQIMLDGVILPSEQTELSAFAQWVVDVLGGRVFLLEHLWIPGLLMGLVTAVAGVFTYLRGRWSAHASESIARRVRDEAYDHLQHLPARYFDTESTGDLVQRCTSDVETLRMFLSGQVVEIGRAIIMLLVPIPLMLAIDTRMTLISVVLLPIIVAFAIIFFSKVRSAFKKADEAEGALTATIQENLTGIRVVRAFARQEHECEKMDEKNATHRDLDYKLYVLMAWYWAWSDLLCFAQKALVVGAGAFWLASGELQLGAFFFFIAAANMFIWPVRMMGRTLTDLGKALVAMERLREILDEPVEEATQSDATPRGEGMITFTGDIRFENVMFSHTEDSPVLYDVSFEIKQGETLAILGASGCGKSTIVNLLLRLYEPDEGRIVIDEHSIADLPRKVVRSQIAVVMQEPFLYSKTLRDNVTLAHDASATEKELHEATMAACVHDSIQEFEDGYDTLIGERGVTLSGGQRQRVALSRALLQDSPILILDDALSAVDTETEALILDAFRRRGNERTTVMIAHRLSTTMHADQILVMDHGRIVQHGTHAELVDVEGPYHRLWNIQTSVAAGE